MCKYYTAGFGSDSTKAVTEDDMTASLYGLLQCHFASLMHARANGVILSLVRKLPLYLTHPLAELRGGAGGA